MNPLFQGKIDNFCAAYSVLNALRLLFGISAFQARDILNDTLIEQAQNPEEWKKIVCHETNYYALVNSMLAKCKEVYHYNYYRPFPCLNPSLDNIRFFQPEVDIDTIWEFLKDTVTLSAEANKEVTAVFRFCRFLPRQAGPMVDHWSTIARITDTEIYLYDCSLETTGWYILNRDKFFSAPFEAIPPQRIGLQQQFMLSLAEEEFGVLCPESIFMIEKKKTPFETLAASFKRKIFEI